MWVRGRLGPPVLSGPAPALQSLSHSQRPIPFSCLIPSTVIRVLSRTLPYTPGNETNALNYTMSSTDESPNLKGGPKAAKSTKGRACDVCQRKKIRCNGPQSPDDKCSNCSTFHNDCTYNSVIKKRGPQKGYIRELENRVAQLEKLLTAREAGAGLNTVSLTLSCLERSSERTHYSSEPSISHGSDSTHLQPSGTIANSPTHTSANPSPLDAYDLESSEGECEQNNLLEGVSRMQVEPSHRRYLGKSSGIGMIRTALRMKHEYSEEEAQLPLKEPPKKEQRRPWDARPWEIPSYKEIYPAFDFPEPDLLASLVDLYFTHVNAMQPLLHRPTFDAQVRDRVYLREERFASLLLVVCAVASRYSDDPRVLYTEIGSVDKQSAGWKWFNQIQVVRRSLLASPTLYDLQLHVLFVQFLTGSSAPHACWLVVGIGLRMAQDVGAHRRKYYGSQFTVEGELWKRAVWVLSDLERGFSAILGRPCNLQDEDIDLDLPIECDDEYWLDPDPSKAFKQPTGKPASVAFFNCGLKLNNVLSAALQTIYSSNKYKALRGYVGQAWVEHTVAELDSALNKWKDTIPEHLKWDPHREDLLHLKQSALLQISYYHIQILIHRPFVSLKKPSPLALSCMAICTNAARSISSIGDNLYKHGALPPDILMAAFSAGLLLILHNWRGSRMGIGRDDSKGMEDVYKCMRVIREYEERWHYAGIIGRLLRELASVGNLPLPQWASKESRKRPRSSVEPVAFETNDFDAAHSRNEIADSSTEEGLTSGSQLFPSSMSFTRAGSGAMLGVQNAPTTSIDYIGQTLQLPSMTCVSTVAAEVDASYSRRPSGHTALPATALPSNLGQSRGGGQVPTPQVDQAVYAQFLSSLTDSSRPTPDTMLQSPWTYQPESERADGFARNVFSDPSADHGFVDMWSNLPMGLEPGDWEFYLNGLTDLVQGQDRP